MEVDEEGQGLNMKGTWVAHHLEVDRMRDGDHLANEEKAQKVREERRKSFLHCVRVPGISFILDLNYSTTSRIKGYFFPAQSP